MKLHNSQEIRKGTLIAAFAALFVTVFLNQSGISAELAAQGFLNENSRPFAAASVKSMLDP
jgi:hypothetical protein